MLRSRRPLAAFATAVAAAVALSGCGGGTPTKADFVDTMRRTLGEDLVAAMHERGLSDADADELIDSFLECQYDALSGEPDLLQQVYDKPGDINLAPEIDSRTIECVQTMTTAMSEAAGPAPSTTTTTLPADSASTTVDPMTTEPATTEPPTTLALPPPDAGDASFDTIPPTSEG